ncbi:ESX secretion-associated protein EspG [Lentzea sp. NBRC 105346]|uniref:ESX secretion-associated protein EspG n=1 Tax=Lentzea sp. NBRC 105346 TaxID=3032205 RepID=UPI0024A28205|nr:ESX secretion-associated protein EspG [Lentzea sp. NBRC 105346]GLZ30929.1 ESX secretion-associated protein EspG [Lentzea sp. NBRC 105346]
MLSTPVLLSEEAFDVLWHHGDLGEHHTVLHVPPAGLTAREVEQALYREGVPVDDTLDALRVLACADVECFGWIATNRDDTFPVVAASAGRHGVFALRDNGYLRLQSLYSAPADALVAHLPEVPPARGASINARADEAWGSRPLRDLMRLPRTGMAKLFAARRDRFGRRHRAESFLTTIDCPDGRWLVVRYTDDRRQSWVHATPASRSLIATWLTRLTA